MRLDPIQIQHRIGPARPMPFPDSGKRVKLLVCPTCQMKKMPWWYAPHENGYKTKCLGCGQTAVIKPKDVPFTDIRAAGGMIPRRAGISESDRFGLDATKMYDETRDLLALGYRGAHRRGIIPRQADKWS